MYAFLYIFMYSIFKKVSKSLSNKCIQNKKKPYNKTSFRARDGTRTRDPDLGKVVLHQLSHSRIYYIFTSEKYYSIYLLSCKAFFYTLQFYHTLKIAYQFFLNHKPSNLG